MIFEAIKRWMGLGSPEQNGQGDGDACGVEMISCEEALARVQEYLDGELDDVSAEQVARHFEVCTQCYPHLASEKSFRRALQRAVDERGAPEEVRTRILAMLDQEESAGDN